jgi:hypothetical protein
MKIPAVIFLWTVIAIVPRDASFTMESASGRTIAYQTVDPGPVSEPSSVKELGVSALVYA